MYENGVPSNGITFKPKSVNSIKTFKMGYARTDREPHKEIQLGLHIITLPSFLFNIHGSVHRNMTQ